MGIQCFATMGCGESKVLSTTPAKSVATDDTYIDDYDDGWSIDKSGNTNITKTANGNGKNNKVAKTGHAVNEKQNASVQKKPQTTPKVFENNTHSYGVKKNAKPKSPNDITHVVNIEEYDYSDDHVFVSNNNNDMKGHVMDNNLNSNTKIANVSTNKNSIKTNGETNIIQHSSKPVSGWRNVKSPVPSTSKNIMNVVDIEDYE